MTAPASAGRIRYRTIWRYAIADCRGFCQVTRSNQGPAVRKRAPDDGLATHGANQFLHLSVHRVDELSIG